MKVLAINGSPNKAGNTDHALRVVGKELTDNGIGFEVLHIGNQVVRGCTACQSCGRNQDEKCVLTGDELNSWVQMAKEADAIILGAPVHFAGIPGTMKSFLDRVFYVSSSNGGLFRQKVGAAVVAVRRSGGSSTFDTLNHYLHYSEMVIAGSNYWNIVHGRTPGEAAQDAEGLQTLRVLGRNMTWLLKMREETVTTVARPVKEKKQLTNFIRG
jgi:multimeric flavodoxin WrbA